MEDLILIGGGGHCKACIDVIEQENRFAVQGIVDLRERRNEKILGYPIMAEDMEIPILTLRFTHFLVTLGQIKSPGPRIRLYTAVKEAGGKLPIVVSPSAYVSPHASIEEGTIVMHGAVVNPGAIIGKNCIINTHAVIEHDVTVESHCHISTGAIVNGDAMVRESTFVGSGTVIREGVDIGRASVVGAGLRIMANVPPETLVRN